MDLSRDEKSFDIRSAPSGDGAVPASAAATGEIVRELLAAPNPERDILVEALRESNRQLQSLLSCVSGTFYRCELSLPWQMDFVSPGIEDITGYPPEYFAKVPLGAIILAEDIAGIVGDIDGALSRGEHFSACYRIRHASGEIRWVSERGAAVCDAAGRPLFLEGFITDVTAARQLEIEAEAARQRMEELNSQLSDILEFSMEGIIAFDADWRYRFINRTVERQLGSPGDLLGRSIGEVDPDYLSYSSWPLMLHTMETREPVHAECVSPDGSWAELYAVPDGDGIIAFFRDISDRKALEQAAFNQARELGDMLDSIPDLVWTSQPDGKASYFNRSWSDFIGRRLSDQSTVDGVMREYIHPDDLEGCYRSWFGSLARGKAMEFEARVLHASGEYRWLLVRGSPQRDDSGQIVKWCGVAIDIHERILAERNLRESRNLQISLLDASSDCIQIVDLDGHIQFINASALQLTQRFSAKAPGVGGAWVKLWPRDSQPTALKAFRRAIAGKTVRTTVIQRTGSRPVYWDIIVSPIHDTDGEIANVLCIARDVTEEKAVSERLRIASEQDVLTGLPNRRAFEKHLKKVIGRTREAGDNIGLMLLDLDHFKHVNDTFGHLAGDHLLKAIARRLDTCVGGSGFVARLGGDEFAIVLDGLRDEGELVETAQRALARIAAPVKFAGKLINGGLSIGAALYPRDAGDAHALMRHADTALYDLKASGRGGIQMFDVRMMEAAERSASQLALARVAIRDDAVEPYYQPKVRLDTGEISGFEALLRWWRPGAGIQQPSSVAEAFNDYELSTRIGGLMQRRVLADLAGWLERGLSPPPVSINAAPAEFLRDDYAERLLGRLREAGIPPALVEIEITEHVFLERRTEQVIRALDMLKRSGVRIALDDFGTGHSSLSHLRDFPVDVLKIDRSFVGGMLSKPRMLAIVQAITKLGPSLSLSIVAEGVETPEQLHALRDTGCEFGQGYLFGKAMHAAEVGRRLASGNWPFTLRRA